MNQSPTQPSKVSVRSKSLTVITLGAGYALQLLPVLHTRHVTVRFANGDSAKVYTATSRATAALVLSVVLERRTKQSDETHPDDICGARQCIEMAGDGY